MSQFIFCAINTRTNTACRQTGEVVTVVTTTTTTTTTTTVRGNQGQQQDVRKDVQTTSTQQPHGHTPYVGNDLGTTSSYATQPSRDTGLGHTSSLAPEVPLRSNRRSGEYNVSPNYSGEVPTSPSSHNFSYPSRNQPAGTVTGLTHQEETTARRSGRFADLKAAAIGLHVSVLM